MLVNILYFARGREIVGTSEEQLDLPEGEICHLAASMSSHSAYQGNLQL